MAIYRTKRENNFSILPNEVAEIEGLSFKAKGILWYLLTKPHEWNALVSDIAKHGKEGKSAIRSGIDELKNSGYLEYTGRSRNEDGTLGPAIYNVYDRPWNKTDGKANRPNTDYPNVEKPNVDNRTQVNTDISNTEYNKLPKGRDGTPDKRNFSVNRFIEGVNNNLDYKLPNDGQARRYAHNAIQLLTRTNAQGNIKEGREFLKEDVFENAQWFMTDYLNAKIERGFHPQKWGTLYDNLKLWIANEGRFPEDKLSKNANASQYAYRKYG